MTDLYNNLNEIEQSALKINETLSLVSDVFSLYSLNEIDAESLTHSILSAVNVSKVYCVFLERQITKTFQDYHDLQNVKEIAAKKEKKKKTGTNSDYLFFAMLKKTNGVIINTNPKPYPDHVHTVKGYRDTAKLIAQYKIHKETSEVSFLDEE